MFKKILSAILASSMVLCPHLYSLDALKISTLKTNAAKEISNEEVGSNDLTFGDLNGDGKINAIDASIVLTNYVRYSTSDDTPSEVEMAISDINADNKVNAVDASYILSYYAYTSTGGKLSFKDYLIAPNTEPSEVVTTTVISETSLTTTSVDTTTIPNNLDTDEDGLTDVYEKMLGTDVNKTDTDGDGLTDYQEVYVTGTDPLISDSVTKDVLDSNADLDNDGLSNAEEIKMGTEPKGSDSDNDGLNDGEEVNTYKTNPLKYDTDGDTISDGDEVKLKTDPTKASSDGKTPDKERKFTQHIGNDSEVFELINTKNNPFKVSIDITSSGYAETAMSADESGYANVISSDMVLGIVPEFDYEEGLTVEDVVLNFDIESGYITNTNGKYAAVSNNYEGIKRFNVFKYFEDINMLLPIETTYDIENNRVTTHVDELGTYCLMDMEKWLENLDVDPESVNSKDSADKQPDIKSMPGRTRKRTPSSVGADGTIDVVFHVFSKEGLHIEKSRSDILETAEKLFEAYKNKDQVHIIVSAYSGALATVDGEKTYASNMEELEKMMEHLPGIPTAYKNSDMSDYLLSYLINLKDNYSPIHREEADSYYVLVEREIIEPDTIAFPLKFETFYSKFPCTVIALGSVDDYKNLAESTEGCYINKLVNFADPVSEFIINKHGQKKFNVIVPTGWKKIVLDKPLTSEYRDILDGNTSTGEYDFTDRTRFADTDKDGIIDISEVLYKDNTTDADLVTFDSNGTVNLPTLRKVMEVASKGNKEYIEKALEQYGGITDKDLPIRILPIKSDPTEKDSDFDGIVDNKDPFELSCITQARLTAEYNQNPYEKEHPEEKTTYHGTISYALDLRDFFKSSKEYNKKMSTWGSVLSTVVYTSEDKRYITYNGEKIHADRLLELHGFEGIEVYDTREKKENDARNYLANENLLKNAARTYYPDCHALKIFIGYKNLEYNRQKKTIIAVVLEGTESSIEQWTSNFDLGSTEEKEAVDKWIKSGETDASDFDEPLKYWHSHEGLDELRAFAFWETPEHHKGFDIVANRLKLFIDNYIEYYKSEFNTEKPSFYITGHSRAAAVANLLSYYLIEDEKQYETFTYTFASPSTTTKKDAHDEKYASIFNIVNEDDFTPKVPMDTWHFSRYGRTKSLSVNDLYKAEWEKMTLKTNDKSVTYDVNSHNKLAKTITKLSRIVLSKEDIIYEEDLELSYYEEDAIEEFEKYLSEKNDDYFRNNCYSYIYDPDYNSVKGEWDPKITAWVQFTSFAEDVWLKKSVAELIPKNAQPFCLINVDEVCETPAFFMQVLAAEMAGVLAIHNKKGKIDESYEFLAIDMADRYSKAKRSLATASGGFAHAHFLQSYIVLSQHITADDFH